MRPFDDDDMPVGPDEYSDLALMMAAVREWPAEEFARDLDARVARRFVPLPSPASPAEQTSHRRRWLSLPALGGVGGLVVAAVAAVIVVTQTGGVGGPDLNGLSVVSHPLNNRVTAKAPKAASSFGAAGSSALSPSAATNYTTASTGSAAIDSPNAGTGAKQIQSAQISLGVPNEHIEQVSGEVFNVVSAEHGYVGNSKVTAASKSSGGGYAFFTLSIPTNNLQEAMTQLSRLRFASVSSRTDASQDVGGEYSRDVRQLHDARALRVSLLKQLQTADSQTAIDSIEAQIKTVERQISGDQSTLHSLQHRIGYSTVSVQINSGGLPVVPVVAKSKSFTIARAGHDAIRVLIVAAGVALIALAVLIPVALLASLAAWIGVTLRQRRRERALDAG